MLVGWLTDPPWPASHCTTARWPPNAAVQSGVAPLLFGWLTDPPCPPPMTDQLDTAGLGVLRELLPVGADVDGRDGDGRSALWHAARRGELGVVVHLEEELGASLMLADCRGRSPLYAAAACFGGRGHLAVTGHGGSVTQPAKRGDTPLWAAAYSGHLAVAGGILMSL